MPTFAFDVEMTAVVRVTADTPEEAHARLVAALDSAPLTVPGDPAVAVPEAWAAPSAAHCVEFDGRPVDELKPACAHCGQPVTFLGGRWRTGPRPTADQCKSRAPGEPHAPWTRVRCGDCGHEAREDEFIPTDGRPETPTCPECESVQVATNSPVG